MTKKDFQIIIDAAGLAYKNSLDVYEVCENGYVEIEELRKAFIEKLAQEFYRFNPTKFSGAYSKMRIETENV